MRLPPHNQRRLNHAIQLARPDATWLDVAHERMRLGDSVGQIAAFFKREYGIGVSASTLYNWLGGVKRAQQEKSAA